ncbi:MAG: NAD(P)-binding domain-containing protein [Anaerolineae bacterium]|nr:NAD(P)-binding domain-containing protein [Anaerolineae bacterium]
MKIAILGTGNIGSTLGNKWIKAGHTVYFGTRNPQKPEVQALIKKLGTNAHALSIDEAIKSGEVLLFAIPGNTMDETITAHAAALDGKIIIDAANKITSPVIDSLGTFAAQTPKAKLYRAFNAYGWENFENPQFGSNTADLFFCGTDGESRTTLEKLIADVGLNPVYLGGTDQAPLVDSLLKLWFALSSGQKKGRHLAFKVLT